MDKAPSKHFNITASVVRQLGDELVSDDLTAILELVKNAYDADASYANVRIDTISTPPQSETAFPNSQGFIIIEDDGFGMSQEDIESGWLVISISGKRKFKSEKKTTPKGRAPLGDKGLGRLSTQRLGRKLEMYTSKEGTVKEYHIAIDWNKFTDENLLTQIPVDISSKIIEQKKPNEIKTTLVISELVNPSAWVGEDREKLIANLSNIVFPFSQARDFRIYLTINGEDIDLQTVSEKIRKGAIGSYYIDFDGEYLIVTGQIRLSKLRGQSEKDILNYERLISKDRGYSFYLYLIEKWQKKNSRDLLYLGEDGWFASFEQIIDFGTIAGLYEIDKKIANPGGFRGELDEFNLDVNRNELVLDKIFQDSSNYRNFVKNQVGVRIFRNQFAIRPYGFEGNDWLELRKGQTSGSSFYGLRPGNVIGYVSLEVYRNEFLKEKTDREGFVDNAFFKNFLIINKQAIDIINGYITGIRRGYNDYLTHTAVEELNFKSETVASSIALLNKTSNSAIELKEKVKVINTDAKQAEINLNELTKMSFNLTDSDKLKFDRLSDEIRFTLDRARNINSELTTLLGDVQRLSAVANVLAPRIEMLEDQTAQIMELASLGLTAETLSHEINNVLDRLAQQTGQILINLQKNTQNDPIYKTFADNVLNSVSGLRKQLGHLNPSLKYVRDKQSTFKVENFINNIADYHNKRLRSTDIIIQITPPTNDFTVKINQGKFTQILDNLILNSVYWLTELSGKFDNPARISIQVFNPILILEDNGLGIEPAVEAQIFEPFITMKPRGVGRGLGLFIVQQLLQSDNCDIILLSDRNKYGRRYRFQLNLLGIRND